MERIYENEELERYLKDFFNIDYQAFLNASPEPTAIRVNSLKIITKAFEKKLQFWEQSFENIKFQSTGYILRQDKLPLSHTLDYFCGNIFYQGVSSQLPVELLDVKPGEKVLDMAAAPGSKSCQIAAKLAGKGVLITNDSSFKRMLPLNVNLQRTGAANFYILNTWGERLGQVYTEYFDKVLLDAPCTALGTLANSKELSKWWRLNKLNKLAESQFALLVSAVKSVRVGGELVYSTCSIAPEENELIIQQIINKYPVEIVGSPFRLKNNFLNGITNYGGDQLNKDLAQGIRIYPHLHGFEGFFAIKLKKYDSVKVRDKKKNEPFKSLYNWDHPKVLPVLEHLTRYWGISDSIWKNFKFNLLKNRIWIVSGIDVIPINKFVCSGILLAAKKLSAWKLFNNSVSYFGDLIKKRRIELDDEKLKQLFKNGSIAYRELDNGYYALTRKEHPFASVYVENEVMYIKLPHSFTLVLDE
jgi:16S rRNA (cytosine1407-C5)-methyltransferase